MIRLRYSLRTLLLSCILVSSCLVCAERCFLRQYRSVQWVLASGGTVHFGYDRLTGIEQLDSWLEAWLPPSITRSVTRVSLIHTDINDDALARLSRLNQLEELYLTGTRVSGSGLKHLGGKKLVFLNLSNSLLNDESMAHLRHLKQLTLLDISDNKITDTGIRHLADHRLAWLFVSDTALTDQGLAAIFLPTLVLDVRNTLVSHEMINRLRENHPLLHIRDTTEE